MQNPPHRFSAREIEWIGEPPAARLQVHEERAKAIVSENRSPDLPFRYSLNPYRGCFHGCAYCYARPSHQFLDFGAGTDFERQLIVKVNAPARLRATFERPGWRGESITFSGNTDCYQPLEASYRLTRACLEVCVEYRNPISIVTKGALVRRDVDVLSALSKVADVIVFLSIPFSDEAVARALEPNASSIEKRLAAIDELSTAGIPTGVAVAPLIPGLGDYQLTEVLSRARDAGAQHAFKMALRLPAEVREVFEGRLRAALPGRADRVLNAIREIRGGKLNESRFGARFRGVGPRWKAIDDLFELQARRLGLNTLRRDPKPDSFRRPNAQLPLFEG